MSSYINLENYNPGSNHNCVWTSPQPSIASSHFNSNATQNQFNDLDDNELNVLASLVVNSVKVGGLPGVNQNEQHVKLLGMWENIRVEQIRRAGLKPVSMIPWLNIRNIHFNNKVWQYATFFDQGGKSVDLVQQISAVKENTILNQACGMHLMPPSNKLNKKNS